TTPNGPKAPSSSWHVSRLPKIQVRDNRRMRSRDSRRWCNIKSGTRPTASVATSPLQARPTRSVTRSTSSTQRTNPRMLESIPSQRTGSPRSLSEAAGSFSPWSALSCCFLACVEMKAKSPDRRHSQLRSQREGVGASLDEFFQVHVFLDRVHVMLAGAEGEGGVAVARKPVGVEPAAG